jgi:hypothetical protein
MAWQRPLRQVNALLGGQPACRRGKGLPAPVAAPDLTRAEPAGRPFPWWWFAPLAVWVGWVVGYHVRRPRLPGVYRRGLVGVVSEPGVNLLTRS